MTLVSGYTLLNPGGYEAGVRLGRIVNIAMGHRADCALVITIEDGAREVTVSFANPLSFRVQDEGDLMDY